MSLKRSKNLYQHLLVTPWWVSMILAGFMYWLFVYWFVELAQESYLLDVIILKADYFLLAPSLYFVLISIISAYRSWKMGRLLMNQTSIETIMRLDWRQFEYLIAEAYRRAGYKVTENLESGADGGVDVIIEKDGAVTLIQCKHWKHTSIGVKVVRELYGVVKIEQAQKGIVACSSRFTKEAKVFARKSGIELMGGEEIVRLINSVKKSTRKNVEREKNSSSSSRPSAADVISLPVNQNPHCPDCGKLMLRRVAKRGKNKGLKFWGCSGYPNCTKIISA
jgi:restriction system protein